MVIKIRVPKAVEKLLTIQRNVNLSKRPDFQMPKDNGQQLPLNICTKL
jgi:hypothetical protein